MARVLVALGKRPKDLPRYARHNLLARRTTMDLGLPWMSYSTIDFLEDRLSRDTLVYELGSGGSTLFFGRRAGRVVSIENDESWSQAVREKLAQEGLDNVDLRHADADFTKPETVTSSDYYRAIPEEAADVIVVDSLDHFTHQCRPILFKRAEELVKPGGIVVVDDSWRYKQLRDDNRAKEVRTFRGVAAGSRRPHWSDVYFY